MTAALLFWPPPTPHVEVDAAMAVTLVDLGAAPVATIPDATLPPPVPDAKAPAPDAARDARVRVVRRPVRRPPRRRPRVVQPPPDSGVVRVFPPATMWVKGGPFKAAQVSVDGRLAGTIAQVEANNGLKLPLGPHNIVIRNIGCKPKRHHVVVLERHVSAPPERRVLPPYQFVCDAQPATIRIVAGRDAVIRRQDGTVLGRTNQDIEVRMKDFERRLALTVGDPGDRFQKLVVSLRAGQRSVQKVDF